MVSCYDAEQQGYNMNMGIPRGKKRAADPPDPELAADHYRHRAYLELAGANKNKNAVGGRSSSTASQP